jgi:hypothetical protein
MEEDLTYYLIYVYYHEFVNSTSTYVLDYSTYELLLSTAYVRSIGNNCVKITEKGIQYIESLLPDMLTTSLFVTKKLMRASMEKLKREELCVYLVHNRESVRNLAKEIYDNYYEIATFNDIAGKFDHENTLLGY